MYRQLTSTRSNFVHKTLLNQMEADEWWNFLVFGLFEGLLTNISHVHPVYFNIYTELGLHLAQVYRPNTVY